MSLSMLFHLVNPGKVLVPPPNTAAPPTVSCRLSLPHSSPLPLGDVTHCVTPFARHRPMIITGCVPGVDDAVDIARGPPSANFTSRLHFYRPKRPAIPRFHSVAHERVGAARSQMTPPP